MASSPQAAKGGARGGAPSSGKKGKDKHAAKNASSNSSPRTALYYTAVAAGVAIGASLLGGARTWWQRSSEDKVLAEAAEKLRLLNQKAELLEKMHQAELEEQNVKEQRQKALEEKQKIAESMEGSNPALGPSVMAAQANLIGRLLELAQKVDALKGDDQREERLAVSRQVEEELIELEASSSSETNSAVAKQQAALVALVRSALRSDREGEGVDGDEQDWSEEGLRKKHGLVTYASGAYWQEAYSQGQYGESFDWYGAWEENDLNGRSLRDLVRPLFADDPRVLVVGCGNSNMSARMYGDGLRRIMNVDISEAVIEQMRERHRALEGLEWRAMDASKLDFEAGRFDVAVEKGLFDALYAGTGERVRPVLSEVERILKPGGTFISVSFAKDRLDRLFSGNAGDDGAQAAPVPSGLSCQVAGELSYRKAQAAEEGKEEGSASKTIYVYTCSRKSTA